MTYRLRPTSKFQRDVKRVERRGYTLSLLSDVIKQLAAGESLPPKYKDHALTGDYAGCRECHITPDWLLIYKQTDDELRLSRTGSHADLFGM